MTTDILNSPVRTYPNRTGVYFFDGRIHVDILGPAGPERDAVLALVGQAQMMAAVLLGELDPDGHVIACGNGGSDPDDCSPRCRRVTAVLRDAGVLP